MGKKINMNQGKITFPTASCKFLTVICRARDASSMEACVFMRAAPLAEKIAGAKEKD